MVTYCCLSVHVCENLCRFLRRVLLWQFTRSSEWMLSNARHHHAHRCGLEYCRMPFLPVFFLLSNVTYLKWKLLNAQTLGGYSFMFASIGSNLLSFSAKSHTFFSCFFFDVSRTRVNLCLLVRALGKSYLPLPHPRELGLGSRLAASDLTIRKWNILQPVDI